jgi:hypothetical protein
MSDGDLPDAERIQRLFDHLIPPLIVPQGAYNYNPDPILSQNKIDRKLERMHDDILDIASKSMERKRMKIDEEIEIAARKCNEKKPRKELVGPLVEMIFVAGLASKVPHKSRQLFVNKLYQQCLEKFGENEDFNDGILKIEKELWEKCRHFEDYKGMNISFFKRVKNASAFSELLPKEENDHPPEYQNSKDFSSNTVEKEPRKWTISPEEIKKMHEQFYDGKSLKNAEEIEIDLDLDSNIPESSSSSTTDISEMLKQGISKIASETLSPLIESCAISPENQSAILSKVISKVYNSAYSPSMTLESARNHPTTHSKSIRKLVLKYINHTL